MRMAVNLSAKQFKDENLSQIVLSALHDTRPRSAPAGAGTDRRHADGRRPRHAWPRWSSCARIGVQLSIDDFGTGYSSMNYLKRFDVRALKIDRSFISGLPQDSENAAITRAIIAMAHGLQDGGGGGRRGDRRPAGPAARSTAATWCRAFTWAARRRQSRSPRRCCSLAPMSARSQVSSAGRHRSAVNVSVCTAGPGNSGRRPPLPPSPRGPAKNTATAGGRSGRPAC